MCSHQNPLPYSHSNFLNQSKGQGQWFLLCHWVKNDILWLKATGIVRPQGNNRRRHEEAVLWAHISKTTCQGEVSSAWSPKRDVGQVGGNSKPKGKRAGNSRCHPWINSVLESLDNYPLRAPVCQDGPRSLVNWTEIILVVVVSPNPPCYNLALVLKSKCFKSFVSERNCG